MTDSDEETYTAPIIDERPFAGLKRKPINFVPAPSKSTVPVAPAPVDGQSIADRYLAMVMAGSSKQNSSISAPATVSASPVATPPPPRVCEVCSNPVTDIIGPGGEIIPHESSLAHQVKLGHSFPPSAIDRTRKGFAFLQAQGWDPDKRLGLGATGEGRLYPVTVKEKNDKEGIGLEKKEIKAVEAPKKVQKLNAKETRQKEAEAKRRTQKLQDMFYRSEAMDKYLGELDAEDARLKTVEKRNRRK